MVDLSKAVVGGMLQVKYQGVEWLNYKIRSVEPHNITACFTNGGYCLNLYSLDQDHMRSLADDEDSFYGHKRNPLTRSIHDYIHRDTVNGKRILIIVNYEERYKTWRSEVFLDGKQISGVTGGVHYDLYAFIEYNLKQIMEREPDKISE